MEIFIMLTVCGLFGFSMISDLRSRQIPNAVPLALLGLFAGYALVGAAGPVESLWKNLAIGGLLLGVGFVFYLSGRFGAGDAKLIAVAGLWAGPADLGIFLFGLGACAFALSLFVLLPFEKTRRLRSDLPFAVAIAPPAMAVMMARTFPYGIQI